VSWESLSLSGLAQIERAIEVKIKSETKYGKPAADKCSNTLEVFMYRQRAHKIKVWPQIYMRLYIGGNGHINALKIQKIRVRAIHRIVTLKFRFVVWMCVCAPLRIWI